MPRQPVRFIGVLTCSVVIAAGCGKSADAPPAGPEPSTTDRAGAVTQVLEDIAYADDAVVLEPSAVRSGLRDDDGKTFRFGSDTPGVDKLAAGSVAVIGGKAVREVTAVRRQGDDVVVETAATTLDRVIQHGTVGFTAPVRWTSLPRESYKQVSLGGKPGRIVAAAWRDDGFTTTMKATVQGFEVQLKFGPKGDKLEFELEATRVNVKVSAKGWISNFVQEARVRYDHGKGTLVRADVLGLRSEADIEWHAVGHGSSGLDDDVVRISLPFEVSLPLFLVGPIPFDLKIKSAIRIVPVLKKDSFSGGSWKVTYDSNQGFKTEATKPGPVAKVNSATATITGETATGGYVPIGFGWGWEFPRFELGIPGIGTFAAISLDTYLSGEWTPGTTLTADIPPCQKSTVRLHAIGLYQLGTVGLNFKGQTTLWEKKFERFRDDKPCTLTGKT